MVCDSNLLQANQEDFNEIDHIKLSKKHLQDASNPFTCSSEELKLCNAFNKLTRAKQIYVYNK